MPLHPSNATLRVAEAGLATGNRVADYGYAGGTSQLLRDLVMVGLAPEAYRPAAALINELDEMAREGWVTPAEAARLARLREAARRGGIERWRRHPEQRARAA
jgi:hypothetical protein